MHFGQNGTFNRPGQRPDWFGPLDGPAPGDTDTGNAAHRGTANFGDAVNRRMSGGGGASSSRDELKGMSRDELRNIQRSSPERPFNPDLEQHLKRLSVQLNTELPLGGAKDARAPGAPSGGDKKAPQDNAPRQSLQAEIASLRARLRDKSANTSFGVESLNEQSVNAAASERDTGGGGYPEQNGSDVFGNDDIQMLKREVDRLMQEKEKLTNEVLQREERARELEVKVRAADDRAAELEERVRSLDERSSPSSSPTEDPHGESKPDSYWRDRAEMLELDLRRRTQRALELHQRVFWLENQLRKQLQENDDRVGDIQASLKDIKTVVSASPRLPTRVIQ